MGKQALPAFFMKGIKQTEAVNHIQGLLKERGFNLPSRHLGEPRWIIFEHRGRQLGVDPTVTSSNVARRGVDVRPSTWHHDLHRVELHTAPNKADGNRSIHPSISAEANGPRSRK